MLAKPTITVAIPVYNDAEVVGKAIRSVLSQTILPYELLIVDDGSQDDLVQVVTAYNHSIVRYIKKEHSGLAKTRNFAVNNARGQYIAFLDADDFYLPDYIENIILTIENTKADMLYAGYRLYKTDCSVRREALLGLNDQEMLYNRLLCFGNFIAVSTVTARIKLIQELGGFNEQLRVNCGCEDWDMWIRVAKKAKIVFIKKILVEKNYNARGPYKRNPKMYRLDQRDVVIRGLNICPNNRATRIMALSNLHYIWASVELEDRHIFRAAFFLIRGAINHPYFPLMIIRRFTRLRTILLKQCKVHMMSCTIPLILDKKNDTDATRFAKKLIRMCIHSYIRIFQFFAKDTPWLCFDAVRWLNLNLHKKMNGYETGSGRSTIFFAKRVHKLTSIENSEEWFTKIRARINKRNLKNTKYIYIPPLSDSKETSPAYYNHILQLPDESLDFVLVDGRMRLKCCENARRKIKPGGFLIYDDSHREPTPFRLMKGWYVKNFTNGVTQTSIFIKRQIVLSSDKSKNY